MLSHTLIYRTRSLSIWPGEPWLSAAWGAASAQGPGSGCVDAFHVSRSVFQSEFSFLGKHFEPPQIQQVEIVATRAIERTRHLSVLTVVGAHEAIC